MEIIIILFLTVLTVIFIYLIFRLVKWIFNNKVRRTWAFYLCGCFILATIINNIFFKKMEFIQSKVYPDIYLIKNLIDDRDSLNKIIKSMVTQKMNSQFISNKEKSTTQLNYSISFYEYYKGWGTHPFGEAGTAHFIEHKEDPGGFSSELLEYYREYKIATFRLKHCKNDTISYFGNLKYYKDGTVIRTDTLINLCH